MMSERPRTDRNERIAVIGAGIAGLTAALELRDRGYANVEIFEKESDVGGKIKTTMYQNRPYELGAVIFSQQFRTIFDLAARYHHRHFDATTPFLVQRDGTIWRYLHFIRKRFGLLAFTRAVSRMLKDDIWTKSKCLAPGFSSNEPQLFTTMSEFVQIAQVKPAAECIQSFMTGCGYGYYDQIPALYLMKLAPIVIKEMVACGLSLGLHQSWQLFTTGWQQLCRDIASDLKVHVNCPVASVRRKSNSLIKVDINGSSELFDHLIVTTPTDAALGFLDSSEQEMKLFKRVKYLRYMVTLIEARGLETASFSDHVTQASAGHINFIVQPYPDTNVFSIYQLLTDQISMNQATDVAVEDINQIGGRVLKFIARKEWRYFPHVGPEDLAAGFYTELEQLQGQNSTYYSGALFGFETTEHTALYSRALIRKFFDS